MIRGIRKLALKVIEVSYGRSPITFFYENERNFKTQYINIFNTMHSIFLELNELNHRAETGQSEKSEKERNILSFV